MYLIHPFNSYFRIFIFREYGSGIFFVPALAEEFKCHQKDSSLLEQREQWQHHCCCLKGMLVHITHNHVAFESPIPHRKLLYGILSLAPPPQRRDGFSASQTEANDEERKSGRGEWRGVEGSGGVGEEKGEILHSPFF